MPPFSPICRRKREPATSTLTPSCRRPLKPESCEWSPWTALAKNSWTSSAPCRKSVKTKMPALSIFCKVCGGFGGPFGLDILSQFHLMACEEGQHQSIMNCSATEQGSTSQIKWVKLRNRISQATPVLITPGAAFMLNKPRSKNCRYIHLLGFVHTSAEWLTA